MLSAKDSALDRVSILDMAAIINSICKTFCSVKDTEIRKMQSYLSYYESLELKERDRDYKKWTTN